MDQYLNAIWLLKPLSGPFLNTSFYIPSEIIRFFLYLKKQYTSFNWPNGYCENGFFHPYINYIEVLIMVIWGILALHLGIDVLIVTHIGMEVVLSTNWQWRSVESQWNNIQLTNTINIMCGWIDDFIKDWMCNKYLLSRNTITN